MYVLMDDTPARRRKVSRGFN
ncbi:hypothetical protein ARTHRO8AJ_460080 [Arthrobacter sp. 8AJ]|nr:hypothetical protein ARTHRO8AJ_460080 [Arthrobacter sp. 8AJ]